MEPTDNKKLIVQKMKRPVGDSYAVAEKYYNILSAVNGLGLTEREVQLIAFAAIKGNISYANVRAEFCEKYKSSPPTINNIIWLKIHYIDVAAVIRYRSFAAKHCFSIAVARTKNCRPGLC